MIYDLLVNEMRIGALQDFPFTVSGRGAAGERVVQLEVAVDRSLEQGVCIHVGSAQPEISFGRHLVTGLVAVYRAEGVVPRIVVLCP